MITLDPCACCGGPLQPDQPFCDNCGLVLRPAIDPRTVAHAPDMRPASDFPTQVLPARDQPDYRAGAGQPPALVRRRLGPALCAGVALVVLGMVLLRTLPTPEVYILEDPPLPPLPTFTSPPARPTAGPTAAPDAVELLQTRAYTDTTGALTFVGVARSKGPIPLSGAHIVVSVLDSDGKLLATGQTYDYSNALIQPGDRLPFQLLVTAAPAQWATLRWQTAGEANSRSVVHVYRDLEVLDSRLRAPGAGFAPRWALIGQVRNTGKGLVQLVEVRAGLYTVDGTFLDVAQTYASVNVIAPGGTVPFEMEFAHIGRQIPDLTHYDLWVDGRAATP
ncbi:MAG: FxLYD domain-containing protein [Chloroflexota bacterium]|nr:FxLYD domain-containing protein [Chloroflexota bacterium]